MRTFFTFWKKFLIELLRILPKRSKLDYRVSKPYKIINYWILLLAISTGYKNISTPRNEESKEFYVWQSKRELEILIDSNHN